MRKELITLIVVLSILIFVKSSTANDLTFNEEDFTDANGNLDIAKVMESLSDVNQPPLPPKRKINTEYLPYLEQWLSTYTEEEKTFPKVEKIYEGDGVEWQFVNGKWIANSQDIHMTIEPKFLEKTTFQKENSKIEITGKFRVKITKRINPSCDVTGPEGRPDGHVNFIEFAYYAAKYKDPK